MKILLCKLVRANRFAVRKKPARVCEQPQKRLRRIPLAQRAHVQIPLALRKPSSIRRDEQRHMIVVRLRKAELPLEPDLTRRGG